MRAKKRDRSGRYYDENKYSITWEKEQIVKVDLVRANTNFYRLDLCDECLAELQYFLTREKQCGDLKGE